VKYKNVVCKRSNIQEAWVQILGFPAKYNESIVGFLDISAKQKIKNLQDSDPLLNVVSMDPNENAPFWLKQVTWDKNLISRFGHKYLSVHFVNNDKSGYRSYSDSLQKSVDIWLGIFSNSLPRPEEEKVQRILFGYTNMFEISSTEVDISEYLNIQFGISLEDMSPETFDGLHTHLKISNSTKKIHYEIKVTAEAFEELKVSRISTEINAYRLFDGSLGYDSLPLIEKEIRELKDESKEVFFSLLTLKAKEILGVG